MDHRKQISELKKKMEESLSMLQGQVSPLHKTLDDLKKKWTFRRSQPFKLGEHTGKIHITNENTITIELDNREQADTFFEKIHLYREYRKPTSLLDVCIRYFKKDI